MRMQFYAIEIARSVSEIGSSSTILIQPLSRNRQGLNDWIYEREHQSEETSKP